MAIRRMVLAYEDTNKKRVDQLNEQIKQAQETLKQAKESDPKSERVFNLETRVNNLKTQRDRLKRRADQQKEGEEKEESAISQDVLRAAAARAKTCKRHGKTDCESTLCPESPNFNVLTQI